MGSTTSVRLPSSKTTGKRMFTTDKQRFFDSIVKHSNLCQKEARQLSRCMHLANERLYVNAKNMAARFIDSIASQSEELQLYHVIQKKMVGKGKK